VELAYTCEKRAVELPRVAAATKIKFHLLELSGAKALPNPRGEQIQYLYEFL